MNARLQHINEINNLVHNTTIVEHTLRSFKDDLTQALVENRFLIIEGKGFWGWVDSALDVVQGACAVISIAAYSTGIGAPIGLLASVVDASIDVGRAGVYAAQGEKGKAMESLMWAGVGMIPIVGDVKTMAKIGAKTAKTIDNANKANKVVKQLDNIDNMGSFMKAADPVAAVAGNVKGVKTIKNANQVLNSGYSWGAKYIDNIGSVVNKAAKLVKPGSEFGSSFKNFSKNYKLANASFMTLDKVKDGKGAAKYVASQFADGGRLAGDALPQFRHGTAWGGGKIGAKLSGKIGVSSKGVEQAMSKLDDLQNLGVKQLVGKLLKVANPFRRSILFGGYKPANKMFQNWGSMIGSTDNIVGNVRKVKGTNLFDIRDLNATKTMWKSLANQTKSIGLKGLRLTGRSQSYAKLPQLTGLAGDKGRIQLYHPDKIDYHTGEPLVVGTQRRNLFTGVGPSSFGPQKADDQSIGFKNKLPLDIFQTGIIPSKYTPGSAPGTSFDMDPGTGIWNKPLNKNVMDMMIQKSKEEKLRGDIATGEEARVKREMQP